MIEKSKSIPLTNKEYELYLNPANYHICNKNWHKYPADENYSRVREHCCSKGKNRGAELSICNLKYNIAKYIPSVFHSGSHYKHKSFSVLIRK